MERIAEMEAMREMITDQEENIKNKEVERENEKDKKKRNQLRDQIKRLKKSSYGRYDKILIYNQKME